MNVRGAQILVDGSLRVKGEEDSLGQRLAVLDHDQAKNAREVDDELHRCREVLAELNKGSMTNADRTEVEPLLDRIRAVEQGLYKSAPRNFR